MNLIDPRIVGPADAYDLVVEIASEADATVEGAELVGLIPASVLEGVSPTRWSELDIDEERTIEARLAARCG